MGLVKANRGSGIGAVLLANLRASPGKSAVLGLGTVVLAVLLLRLALGGKPAAAEAATALVPAPANAAVAVAAPGGAAGTGGTAGSIAAPREPRRPRPRLRQIPAARDPFSLTWLGASGASAAGGEAPGELTLQMILTAGEDAKGLAVISGVVVHPGSTIGRFEVVKIGQRSVTLRDQTQTVTLRMP